MLGSLASPGGLFARVHFFESEIRVTEKTQFLAVVVEVHGLGRSFKALE
jgi:hypothetical protein